MPIQVLISTGNQSISAADYTRYVAVGSLVVTDQINVPTLCDFNLVNVDNGFVVPQRGAYVQVFSSTHNLYPFTGYITKVTERQYLGLNPNQPSLPRKYQHKVSCTSDEYLLNNKCTPFIPVFVNQTKGQILATIINTLAPSGFFDVSSNVASGDIVPYYQYDPSKSFSEIAKQFADDSRYRYKFLNKKFYFLPYNATGFPIQYDSTAGESKFDANNFTINVLDTPLINDVIVIGAPEAGAYGDAIFVGDGFNSNFPLQDEVFRGETQLLLEDDWNGSSFNSQYWTVVDPGGNFSLFQGALNVIGGTGLGQSYILGNNGVELGGQLYLQHGQFIFTAQSTGIIGGVYTKATLLANDCFCGFNVSASGATGTILQPLLNGQPLGPKVYVNPTHQYVMITMVTGSQQFRYNRAYRAFTTSQQFGGDLLPANGIITWAIYDIDPLSFTLTDPWQYIPQNQLPILTTILTTFTQSVSGMPGLGLYAPVNSTNLNFSANTLMIAQPPQATLITYTSPASAGTITGGTQQALGFGLLPTLAHQVASLVQGQNQSTSQLSFYNDTIPSEQEIIELKYRVSQQAMSRIVDLVSIAQQAALAGDDGHRGSIQKSLSPLPRSSEECDKAGQAFITDAEQSIYQGAYVAAYYFTNYSASGYPLAGCYMRVNDPDRGVNQNFLVQKVTSKYDELRGEEAFHTVEFGQDTYLQKTLNQFVTFPNTLRPVDTAIAPLPQTLLGLGTVSTSGASGAFLNDLDTITVLGLSCTGVNLDFGVTPVSGVEIRSSDLGWGTRTVHNLIGVFTSRQVTLRRTQNVQRYYLRQVNGTVTSRRTSIITINCQLPPPQLSAALNMSNMSDPLLVVALPLDLNDFFGVEVRATDNKTVLFHRDFLANSDLVFHLNTSPLGFTVQRNPVLNIYAYNLIGCFGPGTQITTAGILGLSGGMLNPPIITNIQLDTTSDNMTWDVVLNQDAYVVQQPTQVFYDVEIDSTGTASFLNLSVSANHLVANHIYVSPDLVGAEFDARIRGTDYAGTGDWAFFHWAGSQFEINPGVQTVSGGQCLLNVSNIGLTATPYTLSTSGCNCRTCYWSLQFKYDIPQTTKFGGVTFYLFNYYGVQAWRRWWTKEKHETYFTETLLATGDKIDIALVSFDKDGIENAIPYSPQILNLTLTACAGGPAASGGSSTTFEVNGTPVASSDIINFVSGTNATITNPSGGTINIAAVSTSGCAAAVPPDCVPGTAGTLDDEFNGNSLDLGRWTWANQGDATATEGGGYLDIAIPTQASTSPPNFRMIIQSAPSTPWTVTTKQAINSRRVGGTRTGIVLRESGTGKFIFWGFVGADNTISALQIENYVVLNYSSPTAASGVILVDATNWGTVRYLRVTDDGTNLKFYWSWYGITDNDFQLFTTVGRTAWLAGGANQVGLGCDTANASAPLIMSVDWFRSK